MRAMTITLGLILAAALLALLVGGIAKACT